jgi:hypothetical protein
VLELLRETDKLECKPATTPMDSKYKLNNKDDKPLELSYLILCFQIVFHF